MSHELHLSDTAGNARLDNAHINAAFSIAGNKEMLHELNLSDDNPDSSRSRSDNIHMDTAFSVPGEGQLPGGALFSSWWYFFRSNGKTLVLGQCLSFIFAVVNACQATLDLDCNLSSPTFNMTIVYVCLSLHLVVLWKRQKERGIFSERIPRLEPRERVEIEEEEDRLEEAVTSCLAPYDTAQFTFWWGLKIHRPAWQYFALAVLDLESNYFTLLAFRWTTLTSVTLYDALAIPSAMVLSKYCLGRRYTLLHFLGVGACMMGVVVNVFQDYDSDRYNRGKSTDASDYPHKVWGDFFAILGGLLYGFNDVLTEASVRAIGGNVEYLGMLGLFGSMVGTVQLLVLERQDIIQLFDDAVGGKIEAACSPAKTQALYIIFVAVSCYVYMGGAQFLMLSEAAFFNLSLLTGDLWSVVFAVAVEHLVPQPLFYLALILVTSGVVIYEMTPSPVLQQSTPVVVARRRHNSSEDENYNTDDDDDDSDNIKEPPNPSEVELANANSENGDQACLSVL